MDINSILNLSLIGITAFGAVNVMSIFLPNVDSRLKFVTSFSIAFLVGFIPAEMSNVILQHTKEALQAAFVASGLYKIISKPSVSVETSVENKTASTPDGSVTTVTTETKPVEVVKEVGPIVNY